MEKIIINEESHVVQQPALHDSRLLSVDIDERSVTLQFRTPTEKLVRILLSDVRGFSLESMFESNVVFEMRIVRAAHASIKDFRRVFHRNDQSSSDALFDKIRSEDLVFVQIDPTLGADILVLCGNIVWQLVGEKQQGS